MHQPKKRQMLIIYTSCASTSIGGRRSRSIPEVEATGTLGTSPRNPYAFRPRGGLVLTEIEVFDPQFDFGARK